MSAAGSRFKPGVAGGRRRHRSRFASGRTFFPPRDRTFARRADPAARRRTTSRWRRTSRRRPSCGPCIRGRWAGCRQSLGWITRVAMNLARDALRHQRMSAQRSRPSSRTSSRRLHSARGRGLDGDIEIRDDALRLLFVCCHPSIAPDAQVVLALKVLCGFSTGEIARAFLTSEAAIEKQLTRTKQRIQKPASASTSRRAKTCPLGSTACLRALYLLFNEGYKASAGERLLREELCQEAVALTSLLVAHPAGSTPRSHALLALMFLTAARFPSRLDEHGDLLRLDDQDRSKWDQSLIDARAGSARRSGAGKRAERVSPSGRHRRVPLHRGGLRLDRLGTHSAPLR